MLLPEIVLPWPEANCWPNRSQHHMALHRARKAQRTNAAWIAVAAGWKVYPEEVSRVQIDLIFCAPSRTSRFDLDNGLAAMKGALDGLSSVLGVDDSLFRPSLWRGDKSKDGGIIVQAEIVPAMAAQGDNFRRIGDLAADAVNRAIDKMTGKEAAE